jgi:sugar lactone lactonase YvrE
VEDQIRSRIYEALAVEQPPAGLRARVIGAVPMGRAAKRPPGRRSLQWATGFAAVVVTAAVIAGIIDYRGSTVRAPSGKSGAASAARLISPEGIAIAPDGTLYVSDYVGNRVFRIQADGTLVVVAGGGSGSDGPATKANIFGPAGLAVDQNGDLYIADTLGGTIRRVDRNGMITTVTAIYGAGSNYNSVLGLAFDASGVLYAANFNGSVRALRPDGSVFDFDLSSVPSPIIDPTYLAFDSAGSLYLTDRNPNASGLVGTYQALGGGCRIIRIQPDRSVSVIAGTGRCGFSGDGGPAVNAELDDPNGIAFDAAGNLYVADSNNHRIRRIDNRGIITTVAGTGAFGHQGDGGPASKAELGYTADILMVQGQFLYISDTCGCMDDNAYGAVRMLRLSDGTIRTVVSSKSRVVEPS